MSNFNVFFNGQELTKLMTVTVGFNRGVIAERTNTTEKVGNSKGVIFMDTTLGAKTIDMPFVVLKNKLENCMKIASILNVDSPQELTFSDQPDIVYYAMPDGAVDYDDIYRHGKGTIKWLVPDGHSYSKTEKTVTNNGTAKTITFTNNGTDKTPVNVTLKMLSDNGFVGLALNGRYYQIGNPTEVDGINLNKSELLVKGDPMPDVSTGELNKVGFEVMPDMANYTQTGTVKKESNGQFTANYGSGTKGHGPSITFKLPNDSEGHWGAKNYTFRWHGTFGSEYMDFSSVGQICTTLHDKNGKALASMTYSDLSQQQVDFNVKYCINGKEYFSGSVDKNKIDFTGHAYIIKNGAKFTFRDSANPAKTYNCDEIKDSEVCYVSFAFMQWSTVKLPTFISLVNWNFTKDFINEFKDTPNYFKAGDTVVLDSLSNKVYINGFVDWDRVDIGSKPLLANVGDNTLGVVTSDWAKIPEFTVTYRERWL